MKLSFAITAALAVAARTSLAQNPAASMAAPTPLGVWRGTSRCLVRPSACNDEIVVYRISPLANRDSVSIDARKVVRGQEEEMGVLACHVTPAVNSVTRLTCPMVYGIWRFTVGRDSLVGDLRLPDSTKFRDVRTARAP